MQRRVFVTGIGVICAAGNNVLQLRTALENLQSGISKIKYLNTYLNHLSFAEVKYSNDELAFIAGIEKGKESWSRTSLLAIIAAKEAVSLYTIPFYKDDKTRTGLISATTVGGMPLNEIIYRDLLQNDKYKNLVESLDSADSTEKIADLFGIRNHVSTISTACSSSANAIMNGARMIKTNRLDRVIAGGVDALTKFTINGFNSLEILDKEPCKPFDRERKGLTIGEGAAYLILESEDVAKADSIICEIKGFGNANDAYNITASSPEGNGAIFAMQKALATAGLKATDIDYINAHGTGTILNDLSEGNAIMKVFGNQIPHISSTKGFTGHTLAAAGAIEAVIANIALRDNFIPANYGFKNKMEELSFKPTSENIDGYTVNNVLSNSFGFGGNNTSLIFSKL